MEPAIIQGEFETYVETVYADTRLPLIQYEQIRDAFFGGALVASGRLPSEQVFITAELERYLIDFKRRHNIPEKAS